MGCFSLSVGAQRKSPHREGARRTACLPKKSGASRSRRGQATGSHSVGTISYEISRQDRESAPMTLGVFSA
jgi:hypothetical protein